MGLNTTPRANRTHIAIFGKRNSGKSSLINALTGQDVALVSDYAGTTTDPVYKAMEMHPVGPVVFIDTAGFDDVGELGRKRISATKKVIAKTDVALLLIAADDMAKAILQNDDLAGRLKSEQTWIADLNAANVPVIPVLSKTDLLAYPEQAEELAVHLAGALPALENLKIHGVSAETCENIKELQEAIADVAAQTEERNIVVDLLAAEEDVVLLVMPQDIQAPKGRLILPQVQTIRELLDGKCTVVCTTADGMDRALGALAKAPNLIITDSQCFGDVYQKKPAESLLTSFSVLFAAYKGDINVFAEGAKAIASLTEDSRVLIAEACTHAPLEEDIGRVKIPRLLRKKAGEGITIDMVSGSDFPEDVSAYDLVIHCGACMFNRAHVLSRVATAEHSQTPITNYGITMAEMQGILDKISLPEE